MKKKCPEVAGILKKMGAQEKWGLCLNKSVKGKDHCHFATSWVESKEIKSRLPLPSP